MKKDGKFTYDEQEDRKCIIPESVEKLYPSIGEKIYQICQANNGDLVYKKSGDKEKIIESIAELLKLGRQPELQNEMIQYFEQMDIESLVELINRKRRTHLWEPSRHDHKYVERDLPMASEKDIARIANQACESARISREIEEELANKNNGNSHKL
jgi:hypothetical protein